MDGGKIVVRYAKAFYGFIKEKGVLKTVIKDIENILVLFDEQEFVNFLNNILIKPSKKVNVINEILKGKVDDSILKFIQLIVENRKELYLKRIFIYVLDLYNEEENIKKAKLISAYPLDEEIKSKLKKVLYNNFNYNFIFEEKVDKKIIGGFILNIDDLLIDASVKSTLNKLKRELLTNK